MTAAFVAWAAPSYFALRRRALGTADTRAFSSGEDAGQTRSLQVRIEYRHLQNLLRQRIGTGRADDAPADNDGIMARGID